MWKERAATSEPVATKAGAGVGDRAALRVVAGVAEMDEGNVGARPEQAENTRTAMRETRPVPLTRTLGLIGLLVRMGTMQGV